MVIETLGSGNESEWDEYVHRNAHTTFYHQSAWRRIIEQAYGLHSVYLVARDRGSVVGILPLFLVRNPILGDGLISVPFAPYGGVCADGRSTARELVGAAKEIALDRKVRYLELRHFGEGVAEHALGLPCRDQYVTLILDLDADPDRVWKGFRSKTRNQVRKAVKSGLEFRTGHEYLHEFYQVYAEHMRDLGTPVHSFSLFQWLLDECPEQVAVFAVRHQGKTIGGMLVARFKDTLNDLWGCSLKRYFEYCPNNLLYWNAIRVGCKQGAKYFDFGRSTPGSGTFDFKKRWGAQVHQLHYHQWAGSRRGVPESVQSSLAGDIFANVWQRLPVPLTRVLGPWIRRGIP